MKKLFILLVFMTAALPSYSQSSYDAGVVIKGVTWATRNVSERPGYFTANPEDYGGYYTFNAAQKSCPSGWRPPTRNEFESLFFHLEGDWLIKDPTVWNKENKTLKFGEGSNAIYLPAAGAIYSSGLGQVGTHGSYWTSTADSDLPPMGPTGQYAMFTAYDVWRPFPYYASIKMSVRCVRGEATAKTGNGIAVNMRNTNNGKTVITPQGLESGFYIDYDQNFYGNRYQFIRIGRVDGLSDLEDIYIPSLPKSRWAERVTVTPGYGYIARFYLNSRFVEYVYLRIYVDREIIGTGNNAVLGAEIEYKVDRY